MAHIHRIDIADEDLSAIRRTQALIREVFDVPEIPLEILVSIAVRSADAPDLAAAVVATLRRDDPNQLKFARN